VPFVVSIRFSRQARGRRADESADLIPTCSASPRSIRTKLSPK
jgi:hypothetical protein